jgi:hypothetical protein
VPQPPFPSWAGCATMYRGERLPDSAPRGCGRILRATAVAGLRDQIWAESRVFGVWEGLPVTSAGRSET